MIDIPIEIKKPHLEIYNVNKNILGVLTDNTQYSAYNLSISQAINDTTKIKFIIFANNDKSDYLVNENLVRFEGEYYSIKKVILDDNNNTYTVECEHESCSLKDTLMGKVEKIAEKVEDLVNLVLSGSGWRFGNTDIPDSKLRHLISNELSIYGNLVEIANNFNARLEFSNTTVGDVEINSVSVYANSIDNGKFITKRKGYKNINLTYDSSNMVTRLYVFGRNDESTGNEISMLSVHPQGLPYVENFSFFKNKGYTDSQIGNNKLKFVKELTLRNSQLYTPKAVYDYALEEVTRLCYPKVDANVNILDISVIPEYMETPPVIGEKILAVNEDINLILEAQIVSIDKSYENPLDISIGISNVIDKSSSLKNMAEASDTINKITDGPEKKIHGMWIKEATIGSAHIAEASIGSAHIGSLDAEKIDFNVGIGNTLDLQTLISKFVSSDNGQFLNITSDNTLIGNAIIKDAMIDTMDINKLKAGIISTNKFNISSDDGGIQIVGATQQFRDKDDKVRVQIGKDQKGDFNFLLMGEDGSTVLLDSQGIKKDAIVDDLIVENMIAPNAIGERNIDYNSFITGLNNGSYETIKASKVAIDLTGQSLEVEFNELKQSVGYNLEIQSSNGTVFKNRNVGTTLKAIVKKGSMDITQSVEESQIKWQMSNENTLAASDWDNQYSNGAKEVEVRPEDFDTDTSITILCTAKGVTSKIVLYSVDETKSSDTPPDFPTLNQLWVDTSLNPSVLKKFNGTIWEIVNDYSQEIENIKIGGRNLIRDSDTPRENTPYYIHGYDLSEDMVNGQTYTLTLKGTLQDESKQNFGMWLNDGYLLGGHLIKGTDGLYTLTFTPYEIEPESKRGLSMYAYPSVEGHTNRIDWIKLERGTKSTDWTPAPEDIDEKIQSNTTAINVEQGRISGLISENIIVKGNINTLQSSYAALNIEVDEISTIVADQRTTVQDAVNTVGGMSGRVQTVENKQTSLEQDLGGFKTTVVDTYSTKTELNSAKSEISNLSSVISSNSSEINQLKNSITLKVESAYVKEEISKINVVGQNLWKGTRDFLAGEPHWILRTFENPGDYPVVNTYNGLQVVSINQSFAKISQAATLEEGETYTLSAWLKSIDSSNLAIVRAEVEFAISVANNLPLNLPADSFKRYYFTFRNVNNTYTVLPSFFFTNSSTGFYICGLKLEKGSNPTDWSPSFKELEESIGGIKNTITSLTTRISSAEQKITNSAIISTVSSTINQAKSEAITAANTNTTNVLGNYYTISQAQSKIEQTANSVMTKVTTTNKYVSKNVIPTGDFTSASGTTTAMGTWNKNTISASAATFSDEGSNWCNFYTSTTVGELFAFQNITVETNKVYDFSCRVAKYSTAAQDYLIRIQENRSGTWTTVKEFSGIVDVDRASALVLSGKYKATTTQARIWIGKLDTKKFDIWATDFQLFYDIDIVRSSELNVLSDRIEAKVSTSDFNSSIQLLNNQITSKVSSNQFSTTLEQNANSVRIAWNRYSNYVQFEAGGLAIYNNSVTASQRRAFIDEDGTHFWRDNYYLGKMGTNSYVSNNAIKGIVFDIEPDAGYMTWAAKKYSSDPVYTMMWAYANKTTGNYGAGMLHAGCDIDMHNFTLRNVGFEGGGISGTMNFVQVKSMGDNGTANTWTNACKMVFQNGILIDGTWGS